MPDADRSEHRVSLRDTALLSAGTLLSRVLGMVRETLIAALFDRATTDAFFIAWRIPNALRALLAEGALSSTFVPVFTDTVVHGEAAFDPARPRTPPSEALSAERSAELAALHRDALRALVARVRAASLLILLPVTVLGVVFARPILQVMSNGFGGDANRFELSVGLLRVLFPYIFFMGSAAVGIGVLQSLHRFVAPAFAPALLNVAFLLAPFAFIPVCRHFGIHDMYAMAFGALLGGALQLLALVPDLRRQKMLPRPILDLRHPAIRRIAKLFAPNILGLAIYQIDIVLSNRFLAGLPTGSVSYFAYAQRIADIPQGLFIVAIAGASLPRLSAAVSSHDAKAATEIFGHMLRLAIFAAIPASVILGAYGEAIAPLICGYGHFVRHGDQGIFEVVRSLRWQAANIALLAVVRQVVAAYQAAQDTRTPVIVSGIDLLAFIALALLLRGPMGHAGIAAAIAGSTAVQLALLLLRVHRRVALPWGSVLPTLVRTLGASLVTGVCARLLLAAWPAHHGVAFAWLHGLVGGAALGTVYLLAAWLLQVREVHEVLATLRGRLHARARR